MKKIITIVILLMTFGVTYAQEKPNIKTVLNVLSNNEPDKLPFYRLKTEAYRYSKKGRKQWDGTIAEKNVASAALYRSNNYSGIRYNGYIDFQNSEKMRDVNGDILSPNLFKTTKKFPSSVNHYLLVPFIISSGGGYYEDILVSCDKNSGDISDTLFAFQSGYDSYLNNKGVYIIIRQWSINEKGEVTVYELRLLTPEKTYFENAPAILRMKRIDTTYQIDENGKFQVILKKEYQPKNYRKEELYREGKQIWEGNEASIK